MNRIPSLDGIRGIAIALVLIDHLQLSLLNGHYLRPWTETGTHGVTIFFVLSGYLITSKLIEGRIDVKKFYLRRFFRLMPAAWTFLAAMAALGVPLASLKLLACVLSYRNYATPAVTLTAHYWSLSVEEQFYLAWPCLLLLAGLRRARWIAAAAVCLFAGLRIAFWSHYNTVTAMRQSEMHADALLVGGLLALLLADPRLRRSAARWASFLLAPAIAVLLEGCVRFHLLQPLRESVAIAILVAAAVLAPQNFACRILALRPLVTLGAVSYSVYIWQEICFSLPNPVLGLVIVLPVLTFLSYQLIERPCVALGYRLTRSTPSADQHPRPELVS